MEICVVKYLFCSLQILKQKKNNVYKMYCIHTNSLQRVLHTMGNTIDAEYWLGLVDWYVNV